MIDRNDPRLTAYVLGELNASEVLECEAAIANSSDLQNAVEEIRQSVDFLKRGFADEIVANEGSVDRLGSTGVPAKEIYMAVDSKNRWPWIVAATLLTALVGYSIWQSRMQSSSELAVSTNRPTGAKSPSVVLSKDLEKQRLVEGELSLIPSSPDVARVAEAKKSIGLSSKLGLSDSRTLAEETARPSDSSRSLPLSHGGDPSVNSDFAPSKDLDLRFTQGSLGRAPTTRYRLENRTRNVPVTRMRTEKRSSTNENGEVEVAEVQVPYTENVTQSYTVRVPMTESLSERDLGTDGVGMGEIREGLGGDRYEPIIENDFLRPTNQPLSTFSIDVDTASYSKVRSYLLNYNQLPPAGAIRIEEMVNYFPYDYAPPTDDAPFAAHQSVATCPWNPDHKLVRVALKGREVKRDKRPVSNLVFLLDVSGSMNESAKLPLLKRGIQMLINQLTENDRVAIVVYAGAAGTVLDSTTGDQKSVILAALDRLQAGGSTNGGDGIRLAYQLALEHFITGGVNRVILCTDGDFNVGTTSNDELIKLVEEQAKQNIFLSVLGFGMGNLNDSMLEQISNRGNGNYAFIDTDSEANKVLVEQMSGTLITIAKDVKIQVEFNPARVAAYRLIGYENRVLAAQDFNDDKKDAGEIGAGHCVTALYEIVPAGKNAEGLDAVDELKYQNRPDSNQPAISSDEILTLKLRYKEPEGDTSKLLTFPLADSKRPFAEADPDFQFAAAVASFGMQLRQSKWAGKTSLDAVLEMAQAASKSDEFGYRNEFLQIVRAAKELIPKQ